MAKHPRLQITIGPDGSVQSDFSHFIGPNCVTAGHQFHALLAELGVQTEVTGMTPKPERFLSMPEAAAITVELQEGVTSHDADDSCF